MSKKDSIIPIVTPFVNNKIDTELFIKHGENLLKNKMDFLFMAGSTGLGPSVTPDERKKLVDAFLYTPDNIILQCGSINLEDSLDLARYAKSNKIHAVAALPPYYFTGFKREWLVNYFLKISSIYPTIIYNYPGTTGYDITYDIIKDIRKAGGNIIGIKETTYDMHEILSVKDNIDDIRVYTGPDEYVLSAYRENLDGYVSGAGNYAYRYLNIIAENYSNETGRKAQLAVNSLAALARKYGPWSATYNLVKIITGNDVGQPREPIMPLSDNDARSLEVEAKKLMDGFKF
ncbi:MULTISPECIES: dihydrodipicolinate synthase family protein [Acidiplasma]|uniref:2-dehydro-3-deoxyphosphogluconate aldolase n=1 Tax=Acidiplasma aeolicum TaxID=507754 RepID=A0A0P9H000_9ARCH|nr:MULTISPECIES: dihydrodipicolinate synthase family protein [Acidiplasma]KPV47336.1 hypothetical protein SE19_01510 [Acidiplasma aeolicum]WMT55451.1 MAG: dihydrodipicolinate synthase family protein [Acidiplasma sp.]